MIETSARLAAALTGRYRIERELGAGGMATVWLAHDLKHDRKVAIKVLHPHLAALVGADRFLKEIKTTANLQHPHILALHDSGDADGLLFYVMPFVDGESLRQRLTRERQLPIADAVRITSEVAGALHYAHRQGVIHRDIKPENILLHEGSALVADFGIALAPATGDTRLTETGMSIGTPHYMSPEQALGERQLDSRSDIYAVGAMLYEMLTGAPPFTGPSAQAIVAKVISQRPVPPSRLRKEVSVVVEDAVLTALEKQPADRFPTAAELQAALTPTGSTPLSRRRVRRTRMFAGIATLAVVIAVYLFSHRNATPRSAPRAAAAALSIAAFPFVNLGGDPADAFLGDAFPEEILNALGRLPGLTVRSVPSGARFRDPHPDLSARATELEVGTILIGTFNRQGDSIRVTVRFYDVASNNEGESRTFIDNSRNKFALEDSVAGAVVNRFKLTLTKAQYAASHGPRTSNSEAYDSVLLAKWHFAKRDSTDLVRALAEFDAAIQLDPKYADAWAGRANARNLLGVWGGGPGTPYFLAARKDIDEALSLDSNSAEAHTANGVIKVFHDRDYDGAGREFLTARRLDPNAPEPWLFGAQYQIAKGHPDSAVDWVRHAVALDPVSGIAGTRLGGMLLGADSLQAAESVLEQVIRRDSLFHRARYLLGLVYATDHKCGEALRMIQARFGVINATESAWIATVNALCGRVRDAQRYVDSLELRARTGHYVYSHALARIYATLHDSSKALEWLHKGAYEFDDWSMYDIGTDPVFQTYRDDPRFRMLMRKLKLIE